MGAMERLGDWSCAMLASHLRRCSGQERGSEVLSGAHVTAVRDTDTYLTSQVWPLLVGGWVRVYVPEYM